MKRTNTKKSSAPVIQPRKPLLLKRLHRIEGQVRGVTRMIEQDRYCVEVITQLAAIRAATDAVALELLENHTHGCVQSAVRSGNGVKAIDELMQVVRKFSR